MSKIKFYEGFGKNKSERVYEDEALEYVLEKLGIKIEPCTDNESKALEQMEFKRMLVNWYFSGNWIEKWEDVD